jgi:hypothetical protein
LIALDNLLKGLAEYYRTLERERRQLRLYGMRVLFEPDSGGSPDNARFVEFTEAVIDVLRKVRTQLPDAAAVRLPSKEALRKRLLDVSRSNRSTRQQET